MGAGGVVALLLSAMSPATAGQREAPKALLDPAADVTDFYLFRSWADPRKAVLILNSFGGQEPGDGPIYSSFDDEVTYRIHVDNDQDGVANDVIYEFRFRTEYRRAFDQYDFSEPYVGHPNIPIPGLQGITALEGFGSEGLTLRQTYNVTEIRGNRRTALFKGRRLVAAPPNVGPTTMPDYESLAAQAIYSDSQTGIRVFAGPRAETFYSDSGALFDTATLRRFPPALSPAEDADDTVNPFGVNRFAGFNVNSIAIEVPISRLTRDQKAVESTHTPLIGAYASASRWRIEQHDDHHRGQNPQLAQVSRVGNAMINTILIDTAWKDAYNASRPEYDQRFARFFADPSLTRFPASAVFGIPVPPAPRTDLIQLFLKYPNQPVSGGTCTAPCADLLRLDLRVNPTPPERQHRMGALLGGDPAGLPNGRRPNDDATDFTVRIIGGPALIAARVSDGVNFANAIPGAGIQDGPGYGAVPGTHLDVTSNGIVREFPFLPTPHSGVIHQHDH
jgi:hypothetical protein